MRAFILARYSALLLTSMAAAIGLAGLIYTGFYPGVLVLAMLPLIPIGSFVYAGRAHHQSPTATPNYYRTLTVLNSLTILVAVWMCFVILVDRVFGHIL